MSGYLFILGNTPALAFAELSVFYPYAVLIHPYIAYIQEDINPDEAIIRLAGVVKIAQIMAMVDRVDQDVFMNLLGELPETNFTFGISSYSADVVISHGLLDTLKRDLKAKGKQSRFIEAKHEGELSSVVIKKQSLTELVVVKHEDQWLIGKTIVVQDFEAWGKRDFGRPASDPKAGMLPPKVARMMVNLATSETRSTNLESLISKLESRVLLDPFCGMGTILGEAMLMGWSVLGSDISVEVIAKAEKNLRWLEPDTSRFTLMVADATNISTKIVPTSVDAIVTEPFMGNTQIGANRQYPITNDQIKNIIKGLEKLYIGCLKDWQHVLKPGSMVVMALPKYCMNGREFFVKKVIDRCESLGYTIQHGPIEYSRPGAIVKREIFVFHYGTH